MKVYMLVGSTGSYERTRVDIGVFSTRELAEEAQKEHLKAIIKFRCKYVSDSWGKLDDKVDKALKQKKQVSDFPQELKEYWEWKYDDDKQEMSTWTEIKEIELDEILYKWE